MVAVVAAVAQINTYFCIRRGSGISGSITHQSRKQQVARLENGSSPQSTDATNTTAYTESGNPNITPVLVRTSSANVNINCHNSHKSHVLYIVRRQQKQHPMGKGHRAAVATATTVITIIITITNHHHFFIKKRAYT